MRTQGICLLRFRIIFGILPDMSAYSALPFCLLLLLVALLPLAAKKWWQRNENKLCVCLAASLPVVIYLLFFVPSGDRLLLQTVSEFGSFILMLAALYLISGGIYLEGNLAATPLVLSGFLLAGSLLASLMGTTGAAMVLIRPLLKTASERRYVAHTVIFFIILVANIGGALTPLGDPPLFMGYLAGVPFTWTLNLTPLWALSTALLLAVHYLMDRRFYSREASAALHLDAANVTPLRLRGWLNIFLLFLIVAAVALIRDSLLRNAVLLFFMLASHRMTGGESYKLNKFTFYPLIEVAVIFGGIFVTMIPALAVLETHAGELGLSGPRHFFWATGMMSSVLDNTPTYVIFFRLARAQHLVNEVAGLPSAVLKAISAGAVFFGALTYIGNAPNFMVRSIAEEQGVSMPSFFGYLLWSSIVLLPLFSLVSYLWF